jgi:bacterioferritin
MKGKEIVIPILNSLLADELTAINQYMVHTKMCENWGYQRLSVAIRKQAMDEMKHAEWLIERILFFECIPIVSNLHTIKIGNNVSEIIANDSDDEFVALHSYNIAIKHAFDVGDHGTVQLLTKILKMEEGHVEWAEQQQAQIQHMGIEHYLSNQTDCIPG